MKYSRCGPDSEVATLRLSAGTGLADEEVLGNE